MTWQPMRRCQPGPDECAERRAGGLHFRARVVRGAGGEQWANDTYVADVDRREDGSVSHLAIRRADGCPSAHGWPVMQQIKNDIAGPDVEAVELYPAENRVVDLAHQYHLWCSPPGERLPFGWNISAPMRDRKTALERTAAGVAVTCQGMDGLAGTFERMAASLSALAAVSQESAGVGSLPECAGQ